GLAPVVIIGLSAMAVGELTREAIGLYYDRQNAALKEQWAAISLREMAISRMLRVNELMKSGKVAEAETMYEKLRRFVFDHTTEIYGESLFPALDSLKVKLEKSSDQLAANRVLNEARIPYNRALKWYQKGVNLTDALVALEDARAVLSGAQSGLDEFLAPARENVKKLEGLINAAIAAATTLAIAKVDVPRGIAPGEWVTLEVHPVGGIPAYVDMTGSGSAGSYTSVPVYWQAPDEPGTYKTEVRIRDNLKQTANREVSVVVGALDTGSGTDAASEGDAQGAGDAATYSGSDDELLTGVWKVEGTCTSAYLGASLQYLSDSQKDIQEASNAMVGKTQPLPDLDLGLIRRLNSMFEIHREGDYYVITASGFTKETGLGGNRYRIRFTGPRTFEGTMESRSRFGKKVNEIKYNVTGARMPD
ncbi:MAG: hypothetical protein JXX14_21800, partial [Deltaproteobacteria bacterium]|nr:hypothetical protein [Deltaproteobacteria bacterium]